MTSKIELLVGQDEALRELSDALARTADGAGGCVVLEGPQGIGKSRLLESLAVAAAELGVAVAAGQAAELDRVTPLATLLRVLRGHAPQLCASLLEDTESSGLRRVDQLQAVLEDQVRHGPLLVLLDDAHLTDEVTALALRILIPALASSPALWVLARRPGPVRGAERTAQEAIDWLIAEGARQVTLVPLDDAAVAALCAHTLGAPPDRALLKLATRCGGNPFLLRELLTALHEAGQLQVGGGRATVVGTGLPSDFLTAAHLRLYDLSDRVRRLLEAGAVLGRPFTLHEAAGLLGCNAVDLVPAATDAVACGVLFDRGEELGFRHELIREALYDALSGPVRSALHREAATVVQEEGRSAVEAAEHLVLCGRPGIRRAKEVLREAVTQVAPSAPGTAADLTLRMLELLDDADPDRPGLIADVVRLLAAAGRVAQATELGEQALRSGLDAPSEAALLIGLSEALKHAGRNSAVVDYTGRALSREGVPESARAQLLAIRAHGLLQHATDLAEAERAGAEAAEVGARTGQHAAVVFGMVACSVTARARGALEEAIHQAREAVHTADTAGGEALQRHPRLWLGRALAAADQFTDADAVYEMGQREADHLGTAWSQPLWHYYRAELRMAAGRLDDANAEAEAGVRVCEQLAARALTVPLLGLLGQVAIQREELSTARVHLRNAQRLLAEGIAAGPDLTWRVALLADAAGQPAASLEALAEIYDGFPCRLQILTQDSLAGAQLVRIAQRAGAKKQAKAAASATKLLAERNPAVASLAAAAAHAEGLLRSDLTLLRSAVQAYRSSPRMLARASALEDTARAERKAGQRAAAVELLRAALEHYQSCGARRGVTRVTKRLNRLGAHHALAKDTRMSEPWHTLTDSELRVVRLVACGLTNRETAARLFLSPHTVDSHLRHSFTKLGVNSRVELTRQVLAHDRDGD